MNDRLPDSATLLALSRAVTTARLQSGLMHQINNAMLVISGTVELLEARTDLPEAATRGLERVRRQAERMTAAMGEIAAFTKGTGDRSAAVDLRALASHAVDLRRFAIARAGLTIELHTAPDALRVRGDAAQLTLALVNLILSAEQALAGTPGRILVETMLTPPHGVVRVSDTRSGSGPPLPELSTLFAEGQGDGDLVQLGVVAARLIAAAHGGDVSASAADGSAAVLLRLPVA